MPTIYLQNFEGVTPPSLPSGWNFDSGFASVAGSVLSGVNSLTLTATGLKSAFYASLDGKVGQVSVGYRARVDAPGVSSTIKLVSRLSSPVIANFGSTADAYVAEITLGTSNTTDWKLVRQNSTTATTILTGGTGLRTALSAATAYDVTLYTNGNTAAPGVVVTVEVQRPDTSQWLTTTGTWATERQACLAFNDTTATNVLGAGYCGLQANLASGATAYFDNFLLGDYIDTTTYTKVWTDDTGWSSGLGTIVAGAFNGGTEPGIQFPGDSTSRNFGSTFNDRQYGNLPTGSFRFKFSAWTNGVGTFFRVRQHRFFFDGTLALIRLMDPSTTQVASITFTLANFTAGREYRFIWSSTATAIKYAVLDTVTGFYLQNTGSFSGTTLTWCFNYTYPTAPAQNGLGLTVFAQNAGTVLTVGKVTIGPAGTAAVAPASATVATGGSQAFAPLYFTGVDTVATVTAGSGSFAGNTYTAPGTAGSATGHFASAYDSSQSVDVPLTISTVTATQYTISPPASASGNVGVASGNFAVTPNGVTSGTVTLSDSSGGGTFTPATLTWSGDASAKTFTYTPGTAGTKSISITSSPVLTYVGSPITYTAVSLLTTAYVASNGSDSTTNGGSSSTPFLTIAAARAAMVASGGTLNLRGGDTFTGKQTFTAPVTIQSYGTGRATLTAAGSVLEFDDTGGITVNNLTLVNTGGGQSSIAFVNTNATRNVGATVTNCVTTGGSGGIRFLSASATAGGWNNVTITGNECSSATATGIFLSDTTSSGANKHYSNVLIQGNHVHDITAAGGNIGCGIVVANADTSAGPVVIRANHVHDLGISSTTVAGPTGMFPLSSDGVIVEDNLVHDVHCSSLGTDGDAYDADVDTTNCIIQRNYAYNIGGPGMVFFESGAGNICRYNVFVNTGTAGAAKNSGIRFQFTNTGIVQYVYNNIVLNTGTNSNQAGLTSNSPNSIKGKKVYNNLFITATGVPAIDIDGFDSTFALEGNAYQSGTGVAFRVSSATVTSLAAFRTNYGRETGHGFVTTNPLVGYGSAAPTPTDPTTMRATIGTYFDHPSGSPLAAGGLDLQTLYSINPGTLDFKGGTLTSPFSVGAIEDGATTSNATGYTLTASPSSVVTGSPATITAAITGGTALSSTLFITLVDSMSSTISGTISIANGSTTGTATVTPSAAGTHAITASHTGGGFAGGDGSTSFTATSASSGGGATADQIAAAVLAAAALTPISSKLVAYVANDSDGIQAAINARADALASRQAVINEVAQAAAAIVLANTQSELTTRGVTSAWTGSVTTNFGTLTTRIPGVVQPQTGDAYGKIAPLISANAFTAPALAAAPGTSGDSPGVTTLLARVPGVVQPQTGDTYGKINPLIAGQAFTSQALAAGPTTAGDSAGVTTLLSRIPGTVQPQSGDTYAKLSPLVSGPAFTTTALAAAPTSTGTIVGRLSADGLDNIMVEPGVNMRQALSVLGSVLSGRVAGAETGTVTFYAMGGGVPRVITTRDGYNNRPNVTLVLPQS